MKTSQKVIIAIFTVIVLFLGFSLFLTTGPVNGNLAVGSASGTEHYNYENFYNGLYAKYFTQGGGVKSFTATSTQSAYTLTQTDIQTSHLFFVNATNSPALTITLPASSTLTQVLKNPGDELEFQVYNAQTVSASSTTISGGTGTTLSNASTTCVIVNAKTATVRLVKLPNTSLYATCGVQSY